MTNPVNTIADKVMRMTRSMVYLSMRVSYRRGATPQDIAGFLHEWSPGEESIYHQGVVERALSELETAGLVRRAGPRWYPVGLVA